MKAGKSIGAAALAACTCVAGHAYAQHAVPPGTVPPGEAKSAKTRVLEAGASILQSAAPLRGYDIYLVGFHPMKERPDQQMEAHHYCRQANEDFAQCVLFDGNTSTANMNGVEYIISEKLFTTLPAEEKQLWHPHNGEILSGQLVAPGLPLGAEHELMKKKMNSYGKTWHMWNTGHAGKSGDKLPLGSPMLAWSFNRDGEMQPGLLEARDRRVKIDSSTHRKNRADLAPLARPQMGVDELKGKFGRQTRDIPGVVDQQAVAPAGAPPH
jgi:hypothetical protein